MLEALYTALNCRLSLHPYIMSHYKTMKSSDITKSLLSTYSFAVMSSISVTTVDLVNFLSWPTMVRPK